MINRALATAVLGGVLAWTPLAHAAPDTLRLLVDIVPGPDDSDPRDFVRIGDVVVFSADTEALGRELWVTDGTSSGTGLLFESRPGFFGGDPFGMNRVDAASGAYVLFAARTQTRFGVLWRTDGTSVGTVSVFADPEQQGFQATGNFHTDGEITYFTGIDADGWNPWRTDGTEAGTFRLRNLDPNNNTTDPIDFLTNTLGDLMFFSVDTAGAGWELWRTDGTEAGTDYVSTIVGDRSKVTAVNGRLIFPHDDPATGLELWASDGTAGGTALVVDFAPGPDDGLGDLNDLAFGGIIDDRAIYIARGSNESWLVATDGTAAGTYEFTRFAASDGSGNAFDLGGEAVWIVDDLIHGLEPWITDGTVSGTGLLLDVTPGSESSFGSSISLGDNVRWHRSGGDVGYANGKWNESLYRTDGSVGGTYRLPVSLLQGQGAPWYVSSFSIGRVDLPTATYMLWVRTDTEGEELWAICVDQDDDGVCENGDNCLGLSNAAQTDGDADGFGDACDCAGSDGGVWQAPGPIQLAIDRTIGGWDAALSWSVASGSDALSQIYDVVRSGDPASFSLPAADCSATALPTTAFIDDELPLDNELFAYVVVVNNACGRQTAVDSQGAARSVRTCP